MRVSALKYTILSWVSGFATAILLLMPFHAFLTVWLSSLVGHYTALRLWKEVLLVISVIGVICLIATDHKIRSHTLTRRLVWLILAYMLLTAIWGLLALNQHDVSAKALGYGLIVNLRFLAFFLVTWAVALRFAKLRNSWQWLIYWPALVVVIFGLLQAFVLPHDFLRHFGYGPATIPAIETINHNDHYVRVASTLRGANPLGAYLVIPVSLLVTLLIRKGRDWRQAVFLVAALVVLFFTFSRSAWVGAGLSIIVILFLSGLSRKTQRLALAMGGCLLIVAIGLTIGFRHDTKFENFVLHTQTHSAVPATSDQGHLASLRAGLHDLSHHAMGDGPGTAGPASYYNTRHAPRIAENYFIQIGQEVGWLGLAMFILINAGVGYLLLVRHKDPLALSLFASLIGLTFINLLSHAWTDDTLAYVWWGLAGIAMVTKPQAGDSEKT
ncbi:MAG TPA: O-antigen ligase family protein [Candidatus Saccharimonadales bacterium]